MVHKVCDRTKAYATLVSDTVLLTVDDKPMEMVVGSPQDELKDMVKVSDRGICGNEETTPDQGTDTPQGNLELVNNSSWWVKHEGSLSELLASHLPCFLADSIATGWVAPDKSLPAGLPEARAIVTNKAGRRVRLGMKWLMQRLRGGYLFGRRVAARASEDQMPLESLKDYRLLFGDHATPKMQVYDRGGSYPQTIANLQAEKVRKIGILPRGQAEWLVGAKEPKVVKSERG